MKTCDGSGAWRFCPWCGRAIADCRQVLNAGVGADRRTHAYTLSQVATMRAAGMSWKAIGTEFGYSSGQSVKQWVVGQWRKAHPGPWDTHPGERPPFGGPDWAEWWKSAAARAWVAAIVEYRDRERAELDDWLLSFAQRPD